MEHNIGTGVKAASLLLSGTLNCVSAAVHLVHILVIRLTILGFSNFDILSNVPSNLLLLTNDEEHLFENKSWRDGHVKMPYYNGALTWRSFVYIDNGMEFCVYRCYVTI